MRVAQVHIAGQRLRLYAEGWRIIHLSLRTAGRVPLCLATGTVRRGELTLSPYAESHLQGHGDLVRRIPALPAGIEQAIMAALPLAVEISRNDSTRDPGRKLRGIEMLLAGKTVKEVAAECHVTSSAVVIWRRSGITPRFRRHGDRDRGMEMLRNGATAREVATALGVPNRRAMNWRWEVNREMRGA